MRAWLIAIRSRSLGLKVTLIGSSCTKVFNCVPASALMNDPSCTKLRLKRPGNGALISV